MIAINLDVPVIKHDDYTNTVYVHIGYQDALTLSNGNVYGENLNALVTPETYHLDAKNRNRAEYLRMQERSEQDGDRQKALRIDENNLGRRKYFSHKAKERSRTEQYINEAINRMLRTEKPRTVVIAKRVKHNRTRHANPNLNRMLSRRFEGFIRERLEYKCRANGIELVEISSKGTGSVCCVCGMEGERTKDGFCCGHCGTVIPVGLNGARNIEKKAKEADAIAQQDKQ